MPKFRMPSHRHSVGAGSYVTRNGGGSYSYSRVFKPTTGTTVKYTSGPRGVTSTVTRRSGTFASVLSTVARRFGF